MKIHVAHILVGQKYEADDVMRKITEGADFSDLAKRFSTCPSAKSGGDLGEVESGRFVEDFAQAAVQLKPGEVSPITRTQFGYHIIRRLN